ncbi:parapinopsin-like [Aricia agestis]|uniref:parapinopsin-like n=1 Tax=Aricia agestis TaxID=91739 RepID=UPI001C205D0D|nr:parapinopsin-like [Aricia agestis]
MTSYIDVNATVLDYDGDFPLLMPRWGYVASAFVLFLIGFFGFFLNLMVILLMFKDRQLWTPLNVILFNLVCSDFSVSVLGNPLTLISALFHRWVFGRTMCVLYGFFMALLGITSITTLTVISFERYLMVTRPLSARHLTGRGAACAVLFIWCYSLALTTPPLLGWGNYVNEAANISCSVNWHEQSRNTLTYILFLFAMGQIVPLSVITFSYVNIIRTMKRNSQRLGRVSRAEARATAMVFIMIISFTVAWTPYSIFALMEQFATEGIVSPGAGVIPALVAKSSICYDPLIYVGMNTQFRQSIKRVFGIHSKRTTSQTDKNYNNTILSPAHKLSAYNDITVRYNSSETIVSSTPISQRERSAVRIEAQYDMINEGKAKANLSTIQESKGTSENEKSSILDREEEKSTLEDVFGESCQLKEGSTSSALLEPEKIEKDKKQSTVVDVTHKQKIKVIQHSYSLDLADPPREKKRKYSVETKLDAFNSKNFLKDNVTNKIFHSDFIQKDKCRSYLCDFSNEDDADS